MEAVVTQSSDLIGRSAGDAGLAERFGARLLAIGRNDDHPSGRLRRTRLRAGDILVFGGDVDALPAALNSLGCLLLGARRLRAGLRRQFILPVATLLAALAAATAGLAPLWVCLLLGVLMHAGLALTTVPWVALAIMFGFGAYAFVWLNVSQTVRQRAVPTEFQGRVGSVYLIAVFDPHLSHDLYVRSTGAILGANSIHNSENITLHHSDVFVMALFGGHF